MATKKGPTKGGRILVKLPFGRDAKASGKKPGKSTYVRMKEGVAKELGFKPVTSIPTITVTGKTGTYKRISVSGSFRQASITLIFDKPKTIPGSAGTYKTVSIPLGTGCTITDAVKYFEKAGKGVIGVRTQSGQTIRWDVSK